ncbi:MAG: trypsin-like peptidase domain-containing protein [Saprospiraceae bacterium]|nr:trypsin-like peptidase domain-containing protein [Saprospiraceae bacterium]
MKWLVLMICTSLISALLAIGIYRAFDEPRSLLMSQTQPSYLAGLSDQMASRPSGPAYASSAPTDFILAADKVTPAVVNIRSVNKSEYRFLGFDEESSTGSGVILSSDGYIVTNHHVIAEGNRIEVTLNDQREYIATLVGTDPSTDIAVIHIETNGLPYVDFANSDSLRVGEWVVAVGNPFNLESTVTAGIVSAKGRSINILDDVYRVESFIQTDAVINPGNSGGALVNTRGDLIGINTAIITKSGKYEGYSFAVPSNLVLKVVGDLQEFGTVQRGILGINVDNIDQKQAKEVGLLPGQGVMITRVNAGSAAYEGGLRRGDVILTIEGSRIQSVPELQEQVARARPGQTLAIQYSRNGNTRQTKVVLQQIKTVALTLDPRADALYQETGMGIRELQVNEARKFGSQGVIVQTIDPGSKADQVNMEPQFIIRKINGKTVRDMVHCLELMDTSGKMTLEGQYANYPGEFKYIFLR